MNIFKKILKNAHSQPTQLQKTVQNVQSIMEETDEENETAKKKAIEAVLQQIQEHQDMPIGKFMKMLQDRTSLTDDDLVTIITKIPDVNSEKATIAAVQSTTLPPEKITSIVKEADISLDTAEKIVNEIDNKEIQKEQQAIIATEREQQIWDSLSEIYKKCDDIEDPALISLINKLQLPEQNNPKIQQKLLEIVAKRTAIDCMKYRLPRLPTLTNIVSAVDMFEADLPSLAKKQYRHLKIKFDDAKIPYYPMDESTEKLIHQKLIEDIAKRSAKTYDEIGDFAIPQTEKFKRFNEQDVDIFINTLKIYSKNFNKSTAKRLARQLSGKSATELRDINKILEKMNSTERVDAIQEMLTLLRAKNNLSKKSNTNELDQACDKIKNTIKSLPPESQLPTAEAILDTLEQRSEATLLLNKYKNSHSHNDDYDEEVEK